MVDFQERFAAWEQFKTNFCNRFRPADYRETLMHEMNLRTHGDEESLTTFIYFTNTYYRHILSSASDAKIVAKVIHQVQGPDGKNGCTTP